LLFIGHQFRDAIGHYRAAGGVYPRELADLGESLNLMANDAARRVALLRESGAEKSALLLELHHRVKNNFQVITSLLSLLRQEMPAPRRAEIRFVEDFVRAMAVAYRVAYDSGDVTGVVLQDLLRSVLGAQLGGAMDVGWREKLNGQFRLGWSHEYADTSRPVSATFAGAPTAPFTTYGAAPQRDGVVIGLAVNTAIAQASSIYLRYEGDISGQDSSHALTAGVRMTW